jgi:CRISPR system Cascade subunit CasA
MAATVPKRFNLVDEKWIPVANYGLVSLMDIFMQQKLSALGGNPIQKIAIMKLLLAIAQSAYTPMDDDAWKSLGAQGLAERALAYLKEKKDCFWLYGERPFLQMPGIVKAAKQPFGAVTIGVATGNTTVLLQTQKERDLTDAEKTLLVVELGGFALGGKKADNSIVLTPGYMGKYNGKGKQSSGKAGPALGYKGFLHSFIAGTSITESLWLNMLTTEQVNAIPHFTNGLGVVPWEDMPTGEDCMRARNLKTTYLGRLIPLSTFILLTDNGLHYSEGIHYPGYLDGGFDISAGVDFSAKKPSALWADPEKRPWRELTSLLAFLANEKKDAFDCYQLRLGLPRAKEALNSLGVWSGGLAVHDKAGEKFFSGTDDFVESEFAFESTYLGRDWFGLLKTEMSIIKNLADHVYACTKAFFQCQKTEGADQARQASNLFWQLAEHHFQQLINACGAQTSETLRPVFAQLALKAYDTYCPKDTARQLDAWAASRPQFGKYFVTENNLQTSTSSEKGA